MADMTTEAIQARDEARRMITELINAHGEALPLPFVARLEGARDWLDDYEESSITPEPNDEETGCPWVVRHGDLETPDEYCLMDVQPGNEYCPKHQASADALEAMADSETADVHSATCSRCGRTRPLSVLARKADRVGGGLACSPDWREEYDACMRIFSAG